MRSRVTTDSPNAAATVPPRSRVWPAARWPEDRPAPHAPGRTRLAGDPTVGTICGRIPETPLTIPRVELNRLGAALAEGRDASSVRMDDG